MPLALNMENISCLDQQGRPLFSRLDLRLAQGQTCALMAEDSRAITTCVRVAASLDSPYSGNLAWFDGPARQPGDLKRLGARQRTELRRRIGLVQRSTPLISNLTLGDNISLAMRYHLNLNRQAAWKKAAPLTERLGLTPWLNLRPNAVDLSWRRLAVYARELAMGPDLLILELPELDLAPVNWAAIIDEIKSLPRCALIMGVTSDRKDWSRFDLVVTLAPEGSPVQTATKES
jgi:ABC-type transporter Mla maintaining outer membrane lipid asymmetry ATPase subunit MlaF